VTSVANDVIMERNGKLFASNIWMDGWIMVSLRTPSTRFNWKEAHPGLLPAVLSQDESVSF
jgi:hypothetical protein